MYKELNKQIRPDKSRGQNFLIDKNVLHKIAEAAELKDNDFVIEIGTGTGILTKELAAKVKNVVTFEIDERYLPELAITLGEFKNVEIRNESILTTKYVVPNEEYKLVANVPYYITSAILEKFYSLDNKPIILVVLVQKEVADRVCAKPGDMSLLSAILQYYGTPEIVTIVPPSAFWPKPKVDSAVLRIRLKDVSKNINKEAEKNFLRTVKAGFNQKRKMLKNNLKSLLPANVLDKIFTDLQFKIGIRAEDLTVESWIKLAEKIKNAQVK